jgi:hypothetical protein
MTVWGGQPKHRIDIKVLILWPSVDVDVYFFSKAFQHKKT